eukprot:858103-Pyramimonas_sp.AAC.1
MLLWRPLILFVLPALLRRLCLYLSGGQLAAPRFLAPRLLIAILCFSLLGLSFAPRFLAPRLLLFLRSRPL